MRAKADQLAEYGNDNQDYQIDPVIIPASMLLDLKAYIENQELFNYILFLHVSRMTLLVKLINKSMNLKMQQRLQKQKLGTQQKMDNGGIEIDLFQINQANKNEVGKDQDMMETYFLESLKSIYMTIV